MNSNGPTSSSSWLGLVLRPVATTLSAPYFSRRASVSSEPICPTAPVTRIRFISVVEGWPCLPRWVGVDGRLPGSPPGAATARQTGANLVQADPGIKIPPARPPPPLNENGEETRRISSPKSAPGRILSRAILTRATRMRPGVYFKSNILRVCSPLAC